MKSNNALNAIGNSAEVLNLLSQHSNQLARLSSDCSVIGQKLRHVIMICDVVLLGNVFSQIFRKINSNVEINDYDSIIESRKSCVLDSNMKSGLVVFVCAGTTGFDAFLNAASDYPLYKTAVICSEQSEELSDLGSNIDGIISIDSSSEAIRSAFIRILKGETVRLGMKNKNLNLIKNLTPRQKEVLECIREGKCNKEIAQNLSMSVSTVKVHCMAIFRELGVSSRTQAALLLSK